MPTSQSHIQSERFTVEVRRLFGLGQLKSWRADVFTIVVTAATLALRITLFNQLRDGPALIIFTMPIIISAYVGGCRAGLLATAISVSGASYFLLTPFHSFRVARTVDRWDLFFLALAGIAISVLIEALHRARRRADIATCELKAKVALVKTGVLQGAIFHSANFSSIATDEKGVIQIFNVGAERMLGYTAAEVMDKITPADISDPQEVIARAKSLSQELGTTIAPGFEALVFKARRGIEDIYELTYIRKDGSRFPAVVSVTALRDAQGAVIGYLLIGTDNTARKQAEEALLRAGALQQAIFNSANFSSIATDAKGVIQIFNVGAERMLGYTAAEVMNRITPADISDPQEVIARAKALSVELATPIAPGFEALVFKASRGMEDIYELTYVRKDASRFPAVVSVTALRDVRDAIIGYLLIGTDNTARKQVDEALRKSEAQIQTVIENISEAVVVSDLNGKLLQFNPAALEMMGYASLEEGRRSFSDLADTFELSGIDGAAWPVDQWPIARILRGEKLDNLEARMRRIGTDWNRVYSFGGTLAHDANGKPLMAIVTFSDITERKEAEAVRRMNEARIGGIVNSAMDAIISIDTSQNIILFNAAAEKMFRCTAAEALGQSLDKFIPERFREQHRHHVENFGTMGVKSRSMRSLSTLSGLRIDGEEFPIEASISQVEFAGQRIFTVILRDITERHRTDEAATLLASIVQSSSDAIIGKDLNGIVTSWNESAEKIFGYSAAEIVGRSIEVIIPVDHQEEDALILSKIKRGERVEHFETERLRRDGSRIAVWVTDSPIRDASGQVIGSSKSVRDITDLKRAAEEIRQLNADLEQRVVQRTAQLQAANKELEAFSYSVSHDLRAPLRSIDGFSQALLEDYGDKVDAQGQDYLRRVRAASQRMGQLIDDLLNLSRVSRVELTRELVDLSKIAREVVEELKTQSPGRDAEFVVADGLIAETDPRLMRIVLTNLIGNAWKFTSRQPHARIEFGSSGENGGKEYFMRDNGAGFDPDYAGKLFGAFQRLHAASDFPGTGIGLATVQRIVQRQGGRVWAEGKLDQGATFHFTL